MLGFLFSFLGYTAANAHATRRTKPPILVSRRYKATAVGEGVYLADASIVDAPPSRAAGLLLLSQYSPFGCQGRRGPPGMP